MVKFKVKEDLFKTSKNIIGEEIKEKVLSKGDIIEPDEGGNYIISSSKFDIEKLRNSDKFEEIKNINLNIKEVYSDSEEEKNWRIEFDVKTTKSKLKEFKKIFYETIDKVF